MKKAIIDPDKPQGNGLYSSAIDMGDWVIVSGQGPLDRKTGVYIEGSIEEETQHTLENIETVLKLADLDRSHIVKCTCWLADLNDFERYNTVFRSFFDSVEVRPVRSTIGSPLLRGIKVEIEVMARR